MPKTLLRSIAYISIIEKHSDQIDKERNNLTFLNIMLIENVPYILINSGFVLVSSFVHQNLKARTSRTSVIFNFIRMCARVCVCVLLTQWTIKLI